MTAVRKSAPAPKWVIDLHGIKEALTTLSNARARIIDAIQSGEMVIMRSVSVELRDAYPELWPDFVAIKPKKYVGTTVTLDAIAGQLQEAHGSSILGGIPPFEHFQAVAVSRAQSCTLVSAGKGLKHCKDICGKCGIPATGVTGIEAV